MSKKDKFSKMVPVIVKYMNRYAREVLHEPAEELQRKAEAVYEKMYAETPDLGGAANPMADNLYEFMTFCAYYEASGHRIGLESVDKLQEWMIGDQAILGKIINVNRKSSVRLLEWFFGRIVKLTAKKKAAGEWLNSWSVERSTGKYPEGFGIVLRGCPLLAFARAHGYERILPRFCAIDHASAKLMHAMLIRPETEASGGSCCDYWFVGDRSETAKQYADLPKI